MGAGLSGVFGSAGTAGASGVGTAVTAGALGGLAVGAVGAIGYGIGTLIEPYARPHIERVLSSISDDAVSTPTDAAPPEECERLDCELSFATDVAVCRAIGKRSKKRAALCYESAINRKGACEKGLPPSDWPPLITWNN